MPTSTELKAIKRVMFDCAEAASAILLRHFGKITSVVKKGEVDLVTVADKESEKAIIRRIQSAFPDHAILGEESGSVAPEKTKTPKGKGKRSSTPEYSWMVDPLDGTMNFAHNNPIFSVSIAVLRKGRAIMGLVAEPIRGEWFFAERGKGAYVYTRRADGGFQRKRIRVSSVRKLDEALIYTGFPHNRREIADALARVLQALLMCTHGVSRQGSAAIDLCFVAAGRCEAFYEPQLQQWDVAAGALIVEEAGGYVTDYKGKRMVTPGTRIVATNKHIHRQLLRAIEKHWNEG
jgi:myo-inositol-1(or 4)-monophosphatase